jgi:hypothetical protein
VLRGGGAGDEGVGQGGRRADAVVHVLHQEPAQEVHALRRCVSVPRQHTPHVVSILTIYSTEQYRTVRYGT